MESIVERILLLSALAAASAMRDLDEWMRRRLLAWKQRKGSPVELGLPAARNEGSKAGSIQ
jgi:hypothetical protein